MGGNDKKMSLTSTKRSSRRSKFLKKWSPRPKLISNKLTTLNLNAKSQLEIPFTNKEIKCAIWACGNEKAPGPDGFTFRFIIKYWEMMQEDIIILKDIGGWDEVSKIKDLITLGDFIPISIFECMYKIIAKTLNN
uniref:Uncharacterized protein n=1 Tax=Lactuca sativa TaxID=4236 RepID=A0A9R1VR07_LACSA|nr:hypothetical protein LSAT_V11C400177980 [Lactuca sativa]